jgi:hypothetical protein
MSTAVEIGYLVVGRCEPVQVVASRRIFSGWSSPHNVDGGPTAAPGRLSAHPLAQIWVGLNNSPIKTSRQEKRRRTGDPRREGCAILLLLHTAASLKSPSEPCLKPGLLMLINLNPDTAAKTRAYPDEFDCPESDYLLNRLI